MSQGEIVSANTLLNALPAAEYERLAPYLERVALPAQKILHEPRKPVAAIYFPTAGLISLVATLENDAACEMALVGCEGVVGFPAFLEQHFTTTQARVQVSGSALRLNAKLLEREFDRSEELRKRLLLYTQALFTQTSQTAICNRQHNLEQRLARWLLWIDERLDRDTLELSENFMTSLLGISTSSLRMALDALQQTGILRCTAGYIEILLPSALEQRACTCHARIRDEYLRLLNF